MIKLLQLRPYPGDVVSPSPNHGPRNAQAVEGIVLHATEDGGDEARLLAWMRSPASRASCHLMVMRDGRAIRLVGDQQRAWHAGLSWWRGRRDVNSITLGIEIANRNDGEPYTPAQYRRVSEIVAHYCRQGLSLDDVVAHAEIAPGRKTDPFGWDWQRFRAMVQHQLVPEDEVSSAAAVPPPGNAAPSTVSVPPTTRGAASATVPVQPPAHPPPAPQPAARQPGSPQPASPQAAQPAPAKPMLRSRTIWLNGVAVLAAGGTIVIETLDLAAGIGFDLPDGVVVWVLFCVGLVNVVLRFRTTEPVCLVRRPAHPAAARSSAGTAVTRTARRAQPRAVGSAG